jgi:recombination protein RecA
MMKVKKQVLTNLRAEELPPVASYLSTGCTLLDLAIADRLPGGFGVGRISHIYGPESSAKSVLAQEPLGDAQRQGGVATFVDAEATLDLVRAEELFGIDVKTLNYISSADFDNLTIEELFDKIFPGLEAESKELGRPCCVAIDSLSAIPSNVEMEEDVGKTGYGSTRPKSLSKGFRKHIWELSKCNLSLIFVDQTRQNIGVMFGSKYTFSGGEALKFYASTRVFVKKSGEILNKHKKVIGITVDFNVDKNKIAPPFRTGTFRLLFDYGIDDVGTNLQWLKDVTDKKGSYEFLGQKCQSLDRAIKYVEENDAESDLRKEVHELWKEIYEKTDRKKRNR